MVYMGSKSKVAKFIVPILQKEIDERHIQTYIEPFCGGCNVIDKIKCKNRIAADNNIYLIELLKNLDKVRSLPDEVPKDLYDDVRKAYNLGTENYSLWYIGAIGFLSSYNGRFFDGGYSGIVKTKNGNFRNYYQESKNNLLSQSKKLEGVLFKHCDYMYFSEYKNCLFYLDPPYKDAKGYKEPFDSDFFWLWAKWMSKHNIVFVSERRDIEGLRQVWKGKSLVSIDCNQKNKNVCERLYKL